MKQLVLLLTAKFSKIQIGLGKALIDLAKLDQIIEFNIPNNSLPWFALFSAQPEKLPQHLSEQTISMNYRRRLEWLKKLDEKSFSIEKGSQAQIAVQEWKLGIELSIIGIRHAISLIDPSKISSLKNGETTRFNEKISGNLAFSGTKRWTP